MYILIFLLELLVVEARIEVLEYAHPFSIQKSQLNTYQHFA